MFPTNLVCCCIILTIVQTYQQNDFQSILDHWELHDYNKMLLNYLYVKNFKPNRTYKTLDLGFSSKRDSTGNTFKVHVQVFQFYHNEYRRTSIVFDVKICDALEYKLIGIENMLSNNGNITKCPLKKNVYYIHNFNFDDSALPPHWTRGKYQFKFSILKNNLHLAAFSWFGSIEDILKY